MKDQSLIKKILSPDFILFIVGLSGPILTILHV